MSIKKINKINNELISFSKAEFLKHELNEAFFVWNQNQYFTKEFADIDINDRNYTLFLDWFIYDYELITSERSLVSLYWEDNKEKVTDNILHTYRSIFKFKKIIDTKYEVTDIIKNLSYQLNIYETIPENTSLISLRLLKFDNTFFTINHIVAYSEEYKDTIYDSITGVVKETKVDQERLCKEYFYVIEKRINKSIEKLIQGNNLTKKKETFIVKNYNLLKKNLDKIDNLENIIVDKENLSVYNYYDKKKNEFGSIELHEKKIVFNDFGSNVLLKLKENLNEGIKVRSDNISEAWLQTKIPILNNKSPIDAVKNKKNVKKLKEIILELELIYESRTSDDEPFIDPNYVSKKLGLWIC